MASSYTRHFLWCCAGCIRGDDDSTEYYSVLGLTQFATFEEIRKAWRKISLQMHPDKLAQRGQQVGLKEQEEFAKAKDAYQVLSDTSRRQVYDRYGANGVKWLEDPASINPQIILKNFSKSSMNDRCRVILMFCVIFLLILLFPIFLCLKLDGWNSISWIIVFFPLLVFESFLLIIQFLTMNKLNQTILEINNKFKKKKSNHEDKIMKKTQSPKQSNINSSTHRNEDMGLGRDLEEGLKSSSPSSSSLSPSESSLNSEEGLRSRHAYDSDSDDKSDRDDDDGGGGGGDDLLGDQWDREHALKSTRAAVITSTLDLMWQLLLMFKLQWKDSLSFSYYIILLPLLISEIYNAKHNRAMVKEAQMGVEQINIASPTPPPPSSSHSSAEGLDQDENDLNESESTLKAKKKFRRMLSESAERNVLKHILKSGFVVLMMMKLEYIDSNNGGGLFYGLNWWLVFLPLWCMFGHECLVDFKEIGRSRSVANEEEEAENNPLSPVLHACCGVGIILAMTLLVCAKLTGASFSAFWIFFPIFFIAGCLLCCISTAVCCTIDTEDGSVDMPPARGQGGSGVNYSPLVDRHGRTAEAERPPTPERSRPPSRPNYTSTGVDSDAFVAVETAVIDADLFSMPPRPLTEKSPILDEID